MQITIASGKGGAGKTMLATNLAHFLSQSGQVTLLDCDVEEPNCALFFPGVYTSLETVSVYYPKWDSDRCTDCGVCSGMCRFNALIALAGEVIVFDKMCHGCYACSELCPQGALPMVPRGIGVVQSRKTGNLVVTEGRINVGEEQAVPMVKAALRHRDPSCTIIDGPPGTACSAQEVLAHSERIILVTEPTPYGLHDLALITELCLKLGKEPLVVVNRSREPFGPMTAFLKETETPLFIPENKDIAHYYSSGEVAWPHVPVLRDVLEQLRERICHE